MNISHILKKTEKPENLWQIICHILSGLIIIHLVTGILS